MKAKLKLVNGQREVNGNGNESAQGKRRAIQNGFKNGEDEKKKINENLSALAKQDIRGLIDSATYSTMPEVRKKALEMLKGVTYAFRFISANSPYSDTAIEAENMLIPAAEKPGTS